MTPTTIKLPPELKERVSALVEDTGQSMHAFMLEAIARQTVLAERRKHFVSDALAAKAETELEGTGYASEEVHEYLNSRAQGKRARRPKARRWRE